MSISTEPLVEPVSCKLCGKAPAIKSHIIPECFNLGDSSMKMIPVNAGSYPKRVPTGIYDRLLCLSCDQRWGTYDGYAARVLASGEPQRLRREILDTIAMPCVEYSYYKLHTFFISMLWRALQSDHEYFSKIRDPVLRKQIDNVVFCGDQVTADWHLVSFGYFEDFPLKGSLQPILRKALLGTSEIPCVLFVINNLHVTITYGDEQIREMPEVHFLNPSGRTLITPFSFMDSYVSQAAEGMVKNYPNAFRKRPPRYSLNGQ